MERPHYRRVTGSGAPAGDSRNNQDKRSTFSERLVAQFIICGVLMAIILVMNLMNTTWTHNIKSAIQSQLTTGDVSQVLTEAAGTVKTIFGNTDGGPLNSFNMAADSSANGTESTAGASTSAQTQSGQSAAAAATDETQATAVPASPSPGDFRIDEDILTQIQADTAGK